MNKYNHEKIEKKWQAFWQKNKTFLAKNFAKKEKKFILVEFPYPSGAGLHMGHLRPYVAADVYSRFMRLSGKEVLFPIGWDAFGLPAENYAIKMGVHPSITTKKNIANAKKQMQSWGLSFDWSREINTTDPTYYKWTQWLFLQFYKAGLAYESTGLINWCPKDKTGLANEEVIDGKCERCGTLVEKKELRQWYLKITEYAEKLLQGLESLEKWPEAVKLQQENWIGKSTGAEINFQLQTNITKPKQVLIGTRNEAKVKMLKQCLPVLSGIEILSLNDLEVDDSELVEGDDFLENAKIKSEFYFKKTGIPTISTDHILWVEKWPKDKGYIVHMRKLANPKSPRATDQEVIAFFQKFLKKNGGSSRASFHYAVGYTDSSGTSSFVSLQKDYILQGKVSKQFWSGYPVESILIDPITKQYKGVEKNEVRYAKLIQDLEIKLKPRILGDYKLKVFTTRPDTLFGATYMVIAPEHDLIQNLKSQILNFSEVQAYVEKAKEKTEIDRTSEGKEKTGVRLSGVYAINPATQKQISVWVADYVLGHYGTGAIMAVPAHDIRDFEFAKKFNLPITTVIAPVFKDEKNPHRPGKQLVEREAVHAIVYNPKNNKYLGLYWKKFNWKTFVIGGVEKGEDYIEAARREVLEETGYKNLKFKYSLGEQVRTEFFAAHKDVNRIANFKAVVFELENEDQEMVTKEEQEKHEIIWLEKKDINSEFLTSMEAEEWVRRMQEIEKNPINTTLNYVKQEKDIPYFEADDTEAKPRLDVPTSEVYNTVCNIIKHNKQDKYLVVDHHRTKMEGYFSVSGGIDKNEDVVEGAKREILEETGYKNLKFVKKIGDPIFFKFYKRSKNENRLVKFTPLYFEILDEQTVPMSEYEKQKQEPVWLKKEDIEKFLQTRPFHRIFWNRLNNINLVECYEGQGVLINSGNFNGLEIEQAKKQITEFVSGKLVSNYKLRDWVFSRQRYWGEPIPIIHCPNCGVVPVPEKDLPVKLPPVKKYEPTGTGQSPLAAINKWVNTKCPKCKQAAKRETNTMPQWAGSSWYWLRYGDSNNKKEFSSLKTQNYWTPVDIYFGGMEHTTLHLLYSRFWNLFLYDKKLVTQKEPYALRKPHGIILGPDGEKMSKSRGNVVDPQAVVKSHGADTLRMYELFLGPHEAMVSWNDKGVVGVKRFLDRIWNWVSEHQTLGSRQQVVSEKAERELHKLIKKITEDLENFRFNTSISSFMEFHNNIKEEQVSKSYIKTFIILLYPFAPHIAEELNQQVSKSVNQQISKSVQFEKWPEYNPALIIDNDIEVIVQVNGKVKAKLKAQRGYTEQEIKQQALELEPVKQSIGNQAIKRVINVPNRLINFVI